MDHGQQGARMFLIIDISSYWMHGTGGGGEDYDSVVLRDDEGFPALKGRHVRGLMRESSRRIEEWGQAPGSWDTAHGSLTELLFGERDNRLAPPGVLAFPGMFCLPPKVLELGREKSAPFYHGIASTRVEWLSGAAMDKSLRRSQAAVPCQLGGWIAFDPEARLMVAPDDKAAVDAAFKIWTSHLDNVALDVRAVGAKRTRGFGSAIVKLIPPSGPEVTS